LFFLFGLWNEIKVADAQCREGMRDINAMCKNGELCVITFIYMLWHGFVFFLRLKHLAWGQQRSYLFKIRTGQKNPATICTGFL